MEENPNNYYGDKQGVAMKKCPTCHANIEADSVYCEYCGSKVADSRPAPAANTSPTPTPTPTPPPSANIGNRPERPNNYLGLAIASIILCWPFGIPSIVNAAKVNRLWDEGKYQEAQEASDNAHRRGKTGLIVGIIFYALYFTIYFILLAVTMGDF